MPPSVHSGVASTGDPSVSIIVPSYNRRDRLARLLAGLRREHENGARFEVVVGVDGSDDGTQAMLASLHSPFPLHATEQPRQGPSVARNAAIAAAQGDVLLFLDDDVWPHDGLVDRHVEVHRRQRSAAVIGRMVAPPGRALPIWLDWENTMLARHYRRLVAGEIRPSWREFFTANASVRREHAAAIGGFDARFIRGQDIEFAYRLAHIGLTFRFLWDAVVYHEPDRTLEVWLRLAFERGRHHLMLEREMGLAEDRFMREDWRSLHPMNRLLARWSTGHPRRSRVIAGALRRAMTSVGPRRARLLLCSALFNVRYWDGVAEATGLGSNLWDSFIESPDVVRRVVPHPEAGPP